MPRLMLTDEHWSKLRAILLEDRVYDKPEHRNTMEGILYRLFKKLITEPDFEWIFIDGSIVKAHQHSAGANSKEDEAIGKSKGGNTSKIHLAVDS